MDFVPGPAFVIIKGAELATSDMKGADADAGEAIRLAAFGAAAIVDPIGTAFIAAGRAIRRELQQPKDD